MKLFFYLMSRLQLELEEDTPFTKGFTAMFPGFTLGRWYLCSLLCLLRYSEHCFLVISTRLYICFFPFDHGLSLTFCLLHHG